MDSRTFKDIVDSLAKHDPFQPYTISLGKNSVLLVDAPARITFRGDLVEHTSAAGLRSWFDSKRVLREKPSA